MGHGKGTKNFILHGGILAMAGILVRVIGMIYRIPMVNIIDKEGAGLYGTAFNIYNIVLVLSSYGLPMAVSKLVSARVSTKQYKNAHKVFLASVVVSFASGGIAALAVFFGADFIERHFYESYSGIAIPLRILAPTIFIVAVLGVFRGFFQGQGTMIPTAISQLAEQIINAIVSVAAAYWFMKMYVGSVHAGAYGAAGGTLGTCMGAFTALLFVGFVYIIYRPVFMKKMRKDSYGLKEEYIDIFKLIGITMLPIILGQTFYQISAVFDDIIFGKIMGAAGTSEEMIKSLMGYYNSVYMILISLPMGVASAMSASMLPSIVASRANGLTGDIRTKIQATVKANMLIAIPSAVGLMVLGKSIIQLIFWSYDSTQGAMMLKIGSAAVIFFTLSTVTSSALQGIDKMNLPVIHSCISLVIHVILISVLLKFTNLGIYAVVIGSETFPILIMILNLFALYKYAGYRQEVIKTFGVPLVCSIIMGIVCGVTYKLFMGLTGINSISLLFAMAAAGAGYFIPIIILRKKSMY